MDATMASAKEIELLAKIEKLEGDRVKFIAIVHEKVKKLDDELRVSAFYGVAFTSKCSRFHLHHRNLF